MAKKAVNRKKVTLVPGDIVAIPRMMGGYYFIVHIASNQFGEAFGLLGGHSDVPELPSDWAPVPIKYPTYSGNAFVANGRWKRVGHRDDLLGLFPKSPPIYHSKSDNILNDSIGKYGSAETASGELRDLTESDADEIGVLARKYRQIMLEEEFEGYLQSRLG